jgi:hypothetical protein
MVADFRPFARYPLKGDAVKIAPDLDVKALKAAAKRIDDAAEKIRKYAAERGLPVTVYITDGDYVTMNCGRRVFMGFTGKRNLERGTAIIGPRLWEVIEDAAQAYKSKRA